MSSPLFLRTLGGTVSYWQDSKRILAFRRHQSKESANKTRFVDSTASRMVGHSAVVALPQVVELPLAIDSMGVVMAGSFMAGNPATKSLYADLKRRMDQAVAGIQSNLASTRTGRASAHMLDAIKVDYY